MAHAQTSIVTRVSERGAGPVVQGNNNSSAGKISRNGNVVAFYSTANNLPPSGPIGSPGMILTRTLSTTNLSWITQRGDFEGPPLSNPRAIAGATTSLATANGSTVYYHCTADNSVGADLCPESNGHDDVYSTADGYFPPLSSASGGFCGGTSSNGDSSNPAVSGDGTRAAFSSRATNLSALDANTTRDIYVRTISSGAYVVASLPAPGLFAIIPNGDSTQPSLSETGTYVAFRSAASNLVAGDSNGVEDIFYRTPGSQNVLPAIIRASVSSAEVQANGSSANPVFAGNSQLIAFESLASNLVAGDTNDVRDIFVRDRVNGTTTRVSVATGGGQANGSSSNPAISFDGRYVAFTSTATNLVAGDTNSASDIFLHDRDLGTTRRISVSTSGTQSNGNSNRPSMSSDGTKIVFDSVATNLISGDTNAHNDVFLATITPPPANDSCGDADTVGYGQTVGSTLGATPSTAVSCASGQNSPDVYYRIALPTAAHVAITFTGDFDAAASLHTSCPANAANQTACNDDGGTGNLPQFNSLFIPAGSNPLLRVGGYLNNSGNFTFNITQIAPPNDNCSTPTVIPSQTGIYNPPVYSTTLATTPGGCGDPTDCTAPTANGRSVWYSFVAPSNGFMNMDTIASNYDTVVSVYIPTAFGPCPVNLGNSCISPVRIACNNNIFAFNVQSRLQNVPAQSGESYIIKVSSFGTSVGGQLNFNFEFVAGNCGIADIVGGDGNPPADGSVDGNDFQAFLNAFAAADTLADLVGGNGNPPADGGVDGNDFQAFLNAFGAGC